MQGVGEMASLLPLPGMIAQSCARFVDPALGFAVGWNQWYNCAIAIAGETSGAVILVQFWTDINVCCPFAQQMQSLGCGLGLAALIDEYFSLPHG